MALAATGICLKSSRSAMLSAKQYQVSGSLMSCASTASIVLNVHCSAVPAALTLEAVLALPGINAAATRRPAICQDFHLLFHVQAPFCSVEVTDRGHKAGMMGGGTIWTCSFICHDFSRRRLQGAVATVSRLPILRILPLNKSDIPFCGAGPERVSRVPRAHQLHADADAHEQRHAVHHLRQACRWRLGR